MLEAAAERELRQCRWQARLVANLINLAGRGLKRAVTEADLLGTAKPETRKKYKWRTQAQVMQEDAERAKRAAEKQQNG
jgi:hypothetical protein